MQEQKKVLGIVLKRLNFSKQSNNAYEVIIFRYNNTEFRVEPQIISIGYLAMVRMLKEQVTIQFINAKLSGDSVYWRGLKLSKNNITKCIVEVRKLMESNYGTDTSLSGHCIEASDLIVSILNYVGYHNCKAVEGWCAWDYDCGCSDRLYGEHTWVEMNNGKVYVDVTADQFNGCMSDEHMFSPVIIQNGLPYGIQYDEPVEDVYDSCMFEDALNQTE